MRKHGWQLPAHTFQVFYFFRAPHLLLMPFLNGESFQEAYDPGNSCHDFPNIQLGHTVAALYFVYLVVLRRNMFMLDVFLCRIFYLFH